MKNTGTAITGILLFITMFWSCQEKDNPSMGQPSEGFKNYWFAGKAEINTYNLDQSRYRENRKGKAVLIFVTEDFSQQKQVKMDNVEGRYRDQATVLKMNFTKEFITGIYPYSMMLSTFTPLDRQRFPHTLKNVMTSQEWCGQFFTQMNLNGNQYSIKSFSYFENEGDQSQSIFADLIEDETWNLIRIDPNLLPVGKTKVVPGLFYSRTHHKPLNPQQAETSFTENGTLRTYHIFYIQEKRKLSISFNNNFPYSIMAWEETFEGSDGKTLRTAATLDKTLYTDYWNKNKNEFLYLRDSLNLSKGY